MARVALVTLGCAKNAVDSEGLGGLLSQAGHSVKRDASEADVVLVNTCGFIDAARRETIEEVLDLAEAKRRGELQGLILTGCLVARSAPELAEALPEVDALVDFAAYPTIGKVVDDVAAGAGAPRIAGEPGRRFDPAWWDEAMVRASRLRFGRTPWAYLKIAEGCDRGCTFCAIPLMRGKLRSRTLEQVDLEARQLVAQGVSELSLVSQDTVMWGRDRGTAGLETLLRRLDAIDGIERLRLMYLHPQGVSDELIDLMFALDSVVPYFDLSLQHVVPQVLRAMGRWGSRSRFEHIIERIRAQDALAAVRATFILGFPGESEADAEEVEAFVAETDLDWVGTFAFSSEEGTRADALSGKVTSVETRARVERVSAMAEVAMARRAASFVGTRRRVLAERWLREDARWTGRSEREAPEVDGAITFASDEPLRVGDYVDVLITGAEGADLVGERVLSASVAAAGGL